MRLNDVLLLLVVCVSVGFAILKPELCEPLQAYPLYLMMTLLFLSFLRINFDSLLDTSRSSFLELGSLVLVKLIILPAVMYLVTLYLWPEFAIPVLLLSGISTGVVAPFVANMCETDIAPVLRMVVVTSLLTPFTLPALVELLAGSQANIPIAPMIRMLAAVIFVPLALVALARRTIPDALGKLSGFQFPVSLLLFALINMGVFSKYSRFFYLNWETLLVATAISYALALVYYAAGFMAVRSNNPGARLSGGISMAIVNNVLIIVFSSEFFGPLAPTLAAMYMFPFFSLMAPLKLISSRSKWLSPSRG